MKGVNTWSFKPYRPLRFDAGDIYICRLAPAKNAIHLEWLPIGAEKYQIFCRVRDTGDYARMGETQRCEYTITGLCDQTDYEFYVEAKGKRSRVRLARTGECVGTVCDLIDYSDHDPALFGFQYVDFILDSEDILFQCRTAMNGADTYHNANYSTFHRVKNFRALGR